MQSNYLLFSRSGKQIGEATSLRQALEQLRENRSIQIVERAKNKHGKR